MRALADHQSNFPTAFGISRRRTTRISVDVVLVCLWMAFGTALTALFFFLGFGADIAGVLALAE